MTQKSYPLGGPGFGGGVFYYEDGNKRVLVPAGGRVAIAQDSVATGVTGTMASTEATDTFSAHGQPPSGTWASTEAPDKMSFTGPYTGWVTRKPTALAQGGNTCYSSGNRLTTSLDSRGNGLIDSVTTTLAGAAQFADFANAFNGEESSGNGPYYGGTPTAGQTAIVWHLNQASGYPGLLAINGLRFANADWSSGTLDWGNWTLAGSVDGSTFFDLGTFNIVITGTGYTDDNGNTGPGYTINFGTDNLVASIAWPYFALVWQGGSWAGGRLCTGLDFMMMADPNELNHTATVTHSSGLSPLVGGLAGTLAGWQDGLYAHSYPVNGTSVSPTVNGLANGEYIDFDWGAGKVVAPFRVRFNVTDSFVSHDYGTCQWSGSNDGTTFTDVGSSFDLNINGQNDAIFDGFNDSRLFYQIWRLTFVSTTQTQISGWNEITFDMESQTFNTLNVTENPDTMSAHGYAGAFGVNGDLTATETPDVFAALGYQPVSGSMTAHENTDRFSAYGYQPLHGTFVVTEAKDVFAATGIGLGVDGVFVTTEAVDIFTASGYTPISGTWASTENADRFRAISSGVIAIKLRRIFFVT